MSYPRYVQEGTIKWEKEDCDAITDAVLAGTVGTKTIAYPPTHIIRNLSGVYDAIDAVGDRVYGGPNDTGGADGAVAEEVIQAVLDDSSAHNIHFGAGPFTVNGTLETKIDGCSITGSRSGTIFRGPLTQIPVWKLNAATFLSNITVTTQNSTNSTNPDDVGINVYGHFADFPSGQGSRLNNVLVSRYGTGIVMDTGWNNVFDNIYIYNCYNGVKLTSTEGVDADAYNSQFIHFWGGIISENRNYPLWVDRGKYLNFKGTYISGNANSVYLDNVRQANFEACSFEPHTDLEYAIDTPNTTPVYREGLTFRQCGFSLGGEEGGNPANSNNGIRLYNTSNVMFDQPTIAAVLAEKHFLNATAANGNSNITVLDPIYHSSNTNANAIYLGDVSKDKCGRQKMVITFPVTAGQTDKIVYYLYFGNLTNSIIIHKLIAGVYPSPSTGQSFAVTVLDSDSHTMTATVANTAVAANTTTGAYTQYRSQTMLIKYTSSASCASTLCNLVIEYNNRVSDPYLGD